jgi:hypothetical protein
LFESELPRKRMDFETHFRIKFHEAPYIAAQLYGVPHGILRVFNSILYENEF